MSRTIERAPRWQGSRRRSRLRPADTCSLALLGLRGRPVRAVLSGVLIPPMAMLLPNNNNVLILGGTSNGNETNTVEMFTPWTGAFATTGPMSVARQKAAASALSQDGLLLTAGGSSAGAAVSPTRARAQSMRFMLAPFAPRGRGLCHQPIPLPQPSLYLLIIVSVAVNWKGSRRTTATRKRPVTSSLSRRTRTTGSACASSIRS